ncbi:MAG: hypothetical protein AAFX06_08675 [Planctomycetota bacterium]
MVRLLSLFVDHGPRMAASATDFAWGGAARRRLAGEYTAPLRKPSQSWQRVLLVINDETKMCLTSNLNATPARNISNWWRWIAGGLDRGRRIVLVLDRLSGSGRVGECILVLAEVSLNSDCSTATPITTPPVRKLKPI